jgi:hypothetical protein
MSSLIVIVSPMSSMGGHGVALLAIAFLIAVFILLLQNPRQRFANRARQVEGGASGGTSALQELNTSNEPGPPQVDAPSQSIAEGSLAGAGPPQVDAPADSIVPGSHVDAGSPQVDAPSASIAPGPDADAGLPLSPSKTASA